MKKLISIIISLLVMVSSLSVFACNNTGSLDGKQTKTYSVVIDDEITGGTVSANKTSVKLGESVTFTVTAEDGYILEGLYLNGGKAEFTGNTYTVKSVLRDFSVDAVFAKSSVKVYFEGDGTINFDQQDYSFGDTYGELPTPLSQGKYFIGWKGEDDKFITPYDKVTALDGDYTLTAEFGDYTAVDKEKHTPFSITASYYDMSATKYGVVWHTRAEPVNPVLLAVEGDGSSWDNASAFDVETFNWAMTHDGDEWTCSGVVENLKFNTTYSVKFGDYSVGAWSRVYTFTTRPEYDEEVSFVYMTDTQQKEPTTHTDGKTYSRTHNTLIDAITRFPEADFISHGGDLVQEGAYACQWEGMLYNFEEYLFNYPMQFVNGNHEWFDNGERDNPHNTDKIFNIDYPGKDNPNYDIQNGVFYSFDFGPLHYVVLNSNEIYANGRDLDEVQMQWLSDDVTKANANPNTKWVIAMTHHLIYPNLLYDVDVNYAGQMMPVLDNLDIDLVLYGHNHALTVTYPIVWDSSLESDAIGLKAKVVTKTTQDVVYDGVTVQKYIYPEGTTDYGTILHQTGASGIQCGDKYVGIDMNNYPYWSIITGGGKNNWPNISMNGSLSMYTYVEVSNDTLVARTYGVDTAKQLTLSSTDDVLSAGHYLYGL